MITNTYNLYLEDGLPICPIEIFNHNVLLEINQYNLQNIEVVKASISSFIKPRGCWQNNQFNFNKKELKCLTNILTLFFIFWISLFFLLADAEINFP